MAEATRYATLNASDVVLVDAQEAVDREFYCRGAKAYGTSQYRRCGNQSKYYVFVDEADEPRQAVCGFCRNKARRGKLRVVK